MQIIKFKKRYLACVIPALFISACNSGSTTESNGHATINFTSIGLSNNGVIYPGESFAVTAVLTSGASAQTVVANLTPAAGANIVFQPESSCVVSPQQESCAISLVIQSSAESDSYSLQMSDQSDSSAKLIGESIPFSVRKLYVYLSLAPNHSHGVYTANLGGISGANESCANDPHNPLGQGNGVWKATLYGNNPVFKPGVAYTIWSTAHVESGTYTPESGNFVKGHWTLPLIGTASSIGVWFNSTELQPACKVGSISWVTDTIIQGQVLTINARVGTTQQRLTGCSTWATLMCVQQPELPG